MNTIKAQSDQSHNTMALLVSGGTWQLERDDRISPILDAISKLNMSERERLLIILARWIRECDP